MMLGESSDEVDTGKKNSSPLMALGQKLGRVVANRAHSSGQHDRENECGKRDSAYSVSSEGSDDGVESVCVRTEQLDLTPMSNQLTTPSASCMMQFSSLTAVNQCPGDETKIPPDETTIHVMSHSSRQGDGLLQITDKRIGKDTFGQPVYEINCQGKVGDRRTNLCWYFLKATGCLCNQVYLHMLDPLQVPAQPDDAMPISQDMYVFRLCRFKLEDKYVLAAHKLVNPKPPFDYDKDGVINICYHPSKGGMVTLQENSNPTDGRFFGTDRDGNIHFYGKSVCPGYCTNPFTLFYIYDEDGGRLTEELKRANGE